MEPERALNALEELIATQRHGTARSTVLLTDFPSGIEHRWFLKVPDAFRSRLDIVGWPERATQSARFGFVEGGMLYDGVDGYEQHGRCRIAVQVVKARPATIPKMGDRDPGEVIFDLYSLMAAPDGFGRLCTRRTTQDDFLRFVIGGALPEWDDVRAHCRRCGLQDAAGAP